MLNIREKQNLFRLFAESFLVVGRSLGELIVLGLLYLFIAAICVASMFVSPFLVIVPALVAIFLVYLYGPVLVMRIFASKAENNGATLMENMTASILPALSLFAFAIILGILFFPFSYLIDYLESPFLKLIPVAIMIFFCIRLFFSATSIALREENPISAFAYSWQLTQKRVLYTFASLVLSVLPHFLFFFVAGLVVAIVFPLVLSGGVDPMAMRSSPIWIAVGAVGALFACLLNCCSIAFNVLVFLNLDYGDNRATFTPAPEIDLKTKPTKVFGEYNNVLPPGVGKTVTKEDLVSVQVVQTTTSKPSDAEDKTITQHLDQVYQPKPEDIIEYTEEDRMPTILFDDEMAKKLERERILWEEELSKDKNHKKGDDDSSSIKMSK